MDRTTWSDAKLIEALRPRAIVIQIDVDVEQELARSLGIRAMPTVIVFRDGQEIDRQTGLQKTSQLLEWLDRLAEGETSLQRLQRECAANPSDMQLRMRLASKLLDAKRADEATREYVWLWRNMLTHQPSMVGVKHSFLI